jgi:hypothetical protein
MKVNTMTAMRMTEKPTARSTRWPRTYLSVRK